MTGMTDSVSFGSGLIKVFLEERDEEIVCTNTRVEEKDGVRTTITEERVEKIRKSHFERCEIHHSHDVDPELSRLSMAKLRRLRHMVHNDIQTLTRAISDPLPPVPTAPPMSVFHGEQPPRPTYPTFPQSNDPSWVTMLVHEGKITSAEAITLKAEIQLHICNDEVLGDQIDKHLYRDPK